VDRLGLRAVLRDRQDRLDLQGRLARAEQVGQVDRLGCRDRLARAGRRGLLARRDHRDQAGHLGLAVRVELRADLLGLRARQDQVVHQVYPDRLDRAGHRGLLARRGHQGQAGQEDRRARRVQLVSV